MRHLRTAIFIAGAVAYLAGCGGGGGSDAQTAGSESAAQVTTTSTTVADATATRWVPGTSDTWQWQLHGTLNTSYAVNVYDIDLFETSQATIDTLHAQGRRVVCYFSAGSSEDWRSDFSRFLPADMGEPLDDWPGERWLDVRSDNVKAIMRSRLDLARSKGCDGVEPDNVDGYTNGSGFDLSAEDQLAYNRFLAQEAHARGLAIGLKNDLDQVDALTADFDFAVNEQCFENEECSAYENFTAAGKAVFSAEYASVYRDNTDGARDKMCAAARAANLRTLVLPLSLDDSFRYSCDS